VDDAFVSVGRVGRPHGLDGAFVVEHGSDDERRYRVGAVLHVGGVPATVILSRRVGRGRHAILLDRKVERGETLTILRADLPTLPEDEYYTFEIIGLRVEEVGGRTLGTVRDVLPGSANDNLELDDGTLVPMIEDAIASIDPNEGVVLLNPGFIV
jgi:16S rRNA processing protein RimM